MNNQDLRNFVLAVLDDDNGIRETAWDQLQELLQAHEAISPEYRMLDASGPDHDRTFICAVRHKGRELARGQGKSKKIAETQAAATAIIAFEKSSQISKQPNK